MDALDCCFGAGDVAAIATAVQARDEDWLRQAGALMAAASPTSLAVIFRQLEEGRGLEFEAAIAREYRMACAFLAGDEFVEGIRAAVVDKDRRPRWTPPTLAEALAAGTDRFFAREVLFEFRRVGAYIKVSAIDVATGTEVSIVGGATMGEAQLKLTALRKLEYVLAKTAAAR
jgi:hypothetical protein